MFPAPPGEKKSYKSAKYSGGRKWGATREADEIRSDFTQWPDANVGIPTGAENGIFVVEADTMEGHGVDGLAALAAMNLPETLQSESPNGSVHCYFKHLGLRRIPNSTSKLAPGIDVRGDGGMVLAPPSVKPNVGVYMWRNSLPIADAPQWLLDKVTASEKPEREAVQDGKVGQWDLEDAKALYEFLRDNGCIESDDDWFKAGMVAKLEFGEAGLELWEAAGDGSGLSDNSEKRWKSFASEPRPGCVRLETLMKKAHEAGWTGSVRKSTEAMFDGVAAMPSLPIAPTGTERRSLRARRVNAASLAGKPVPEREWLVPDWIPMEQVTLLYADGATGKSLLSMQLGVAVATNNPWFNIPVKHGKVEFITAEDSAGELHRRLADVSRETGLPLESMGNLHVSSFADEDAIMAALTGGGQLVKTGFYDEVVQIVRETKPVLLVLDTLADIFGGNEIIRAQARAFINMLRKIAIEYNLAVIVLGHPSATGLTNGKGTSGSTGWSNSVRSRLYMERVLGEDGVEIDRDARVLKSMKMNYGNVGNEIRMRYQKGIFVPEIGFHGVAGDPLVNALRAEQVFLELLDRANEQNTHVNATPQANNYAPKVFARDALKKKGVKKSELVNAMQGLLDRKVIENAPYGPSYRRTYRLQRM